MEPATFPLYSRDLQPGFTFVAEIHVIGGRTWTSPGISVGPGLLAVLDVNVDAFGDCSGSDLHAIITAEPALPNRALLPPNHAPTQ